MSQVASEETTPGNNEPSLDELLRQFVEVKAKADGYYAEKRAIEDRIVSFELVQRHPMSNGSKTTKSASYKVSVKDEKKAKLRRDTGASWPDVWSVCDAAGLTEEMMPIKLVREVDVKKLDNIQEKNPDLYFQLCDLIERYQARPSFAVTEV